MAILLQNINMSFGGKVIFQDFTYEFPKTGVTCVMGPSGSGKTTLIRIICGLQKPDSGTISGCGRPSVMFQEDRLFPWLTAGQNIAAVNEREGKKYLDMVRLGDELNTMPKDLSGGMARRVSLARALAYDGDALLLDEPFKGLDEALRDEVRQLVAEKAKTLPVVVVTHDKEDCEALDAKVLALS